MRDHSIEGRYTAYFGMLLIPHTLGVVMDIVHRGHLERSSARYLSEIQDMWHQIVYDQSSKLPCLGHC